MTGSEPLGDALLVPLAADVGADNRGWVQLARSTGGVVKNGDQSFEITSEDVAAYAAHIRANAGRVSIDYDHSHGKGQGSRAAGWVDADSVEVRNGNELWAQVDWTPSAADAIRAGEYRYISPEITFEEKKDGVLRKAAKFLAAALTNRPFFKDMAPVALVRLENDDPNPEDTMEPEAQLAALNKRAGEILLERKVVAASTSQLMSAIELAEAELGVTYAVLQRRRRGLPDVVATEDAVRLRFDSADVDVRARAILVERGLDPLTCSQAEYLEAAQAAVRVSA